MENKMENFIKTLDNTVFCFSPFFHSKRNRTELEKVKKEANMGDWRYGTCFVLGINKDSFQPAKDRTDEDMTEVSKIMRGLEKVTREWLFMVFRNTRSSWHHMSLPRDRLKTNKRSTEVFHCTIGSWIKEHTACGQDSCQKCTISKSNRASWQTKNWGLPKMLIIPRLQKGNHQSKKKGCEE